MFLETAFLSTIINVVVTQIYIPSQPIAYESKYAPQYTNYKPKNYAFEYGVSDPRTGDHKSQWEKRDNGVTIGMYSLLEPDGSKRVVEYIADSLYGFRALVKKIPIHPHQLPVVYSAGYNFAPSENLHDNSNNNNNNKDDTPKAGYNVVPSENLHDNSNFNTNDKDDTHEAIILNSTEYVDEEHENQQQEEGEEEPINKETEEVDTRRKENEESEDSGYTDDDHENEKNEDGDEFSFSSYRLYDNDDDENDE